MTAVNLKTLLSKANKNNYAVAGLVVMFTLFPDS